MVQFGTQRTKGIHAICGYSGSEVIEMNVQKDHVHLIVMVPPKIAISDLMGRLKGQTAIKTFRQFPHLRQKPYWGNQFWSKGYCVDTVGLDEEMIRKYPFAVAPLRANRKVSPPPHTSRISSKILFDVAFFCFIVYMYMLHN